MFLSYSHKDDELREELLTHLKLFERQNLIDSWHDRRITAGDEWKGQIDDNLERADIILLLVSPSFFDSDYCYNVEMTRALERHEAKNARVIPILVRDVHWMPAPFAKLKVLPTDGVAVATEGRDRNARDSAWRNVANGIEDVLKELRGS